MNAMSTLSLPPITNVFERGLSLDEIRERAPAVFASDADPRVSSKYTFIPTDRLLAGLMNAGFIPMTARQTLPRRKNAFHTRHMLRLRRRFETVQLKDAVPEIVFLNSHDGSAAYQLRMGIYRVVCTNGLIVSHGALPLYRVSHRGDIVEDVIASALNMAEHFGDLATQVEQMEQRNLSMDEQQQFAERALALRFPDVASSDIQLSQLLVCRRSEDVGDDLWRTFNRVQENLLAGGFGRRSRSGRWIRTRRISAIQREVRLNSDLWDLAMRTLAA